MEPMWDPHILGIPIATSVNFQFVLITWEVMPKNAVQLGDVQASTVKATPNIPTKKYLRCLTWAAYRSQTSLEIALWLGMIGGAWELIRVIRLTKEAYSTIKKGRLVLAMK